MNASSKLAFVSNLCMLGATLGVSAMRVVWPARVRGLSTLIIPAFLLSFSSEAAQPDVRPIPAPGVTIAEKDRSELTAEAERLAGEIARLRTDLKQKAALLKLVPEVEIFHKAVQEALAHNEIYNATNEVSAARNLLKLGLERAQQLRGGNAPWLSATGLVVRAYVSKIDGSVQPYGLVVPPSFSHTSPHAYRLDVWFHGRDEKLTELSFLAQRLRSPGEFTPPNTIVLHPYGRYCNANKFAGEVDLFEALGHIREYYNIDENRIAVRGFSMGGAACWQFATHYAGLWAAAAPGAGFAETPRFLNLSPSDSRPWYETNLWHFYDSTDYALNLFNCPVVAYSGEIDKQKQAADAMAEALAAEGIELSHVIGPQTAHRYHPAAREEVNRRIDSIMSRGRNPVPREVRLTTWTLRYNQMHWVTVDGLYQHWQRARVHAEWDAAVNVIRAVTTNVSALTLEFAPALYPLDPARPPIILLDDQKLAGPKPLSDRSFTAHFVRRGAKWVVSEGLPDTTLRKRHGLQGPIDDAFMDSFLIVRPTGSAFSEQAKQWVENEFTRATNEWRRQFRGEARVKNDTDVDEADIAAHNLILWGDPSSNRLLSKIASQLPIQWRDQTIALGRHELPSATHVPVLIYPNPLNPRHYVVLNSGFTFREADYLSNARQNAKLPDYAVVDVTQPPDAYAPGKVVDAGFFDEEWRLMQAEGAGQ